MVNTYDELRGDGNLAIADVEAGNLAEATKKTILACYDKGVRVETPKHQYGGSLGYDAEMMVRVKDTESPIQIYTPGMPADGNVLAQYILEVTHGSFNHRKKSKESPNYWGYAYNERFVNQLPFVFQRINHDWDERKKIEGEGRITGRDYQFAIWIAGEDIPLEQPDAPCFQLGTFRFLKNNKGEWVMNYKTSWRSRCQYKAWNMNNVAQLKLMKLARDKTSDMLGIPIKMGSYVDISSNHLYGLYIDNDNLENQIKIIKNESEETFKLRCKNLEEYILAETGKDDMKQVHRFIAVQLDAEIKGHGKQLPEKTLKQLGYDIDNFPYPSDWDTWPKEWDTEPDIDKLARVYNNDEVLKRAGKILGMSVDDLKIASDLYHKDPKKKSWILHHEHFMK
jgi:hypothetical protein